MKRSSGIKAIVRIASLTLAMIMCFVMMSVITMIPVTAAEYEGRGSKSDPYLVKTAQQLNNIRKNLSAHYKLAATIDLSGIANFKPIGSLKTPFTGSLTCDTDASGKPIYAIKNLKIRVEYDAGKNINTVAERNTLYKADGSSGWEVGLFGCVNNASFSNIVILNADVFAKIPGGSQDAGKEGTRLGVNEQGAAIFIGIAVGVTMENCGVTGRLECTLGNFVGTMAGLIKDKVTSDGNNGKVLVSTNRQSKFTKCYSYADAITSGVLWNAAGFCGGSINTLFNGCFYSGKQTGGWQNIGGFDGYGDPSTRYTNCYTEGSAYKASFSGNATVIDIAQNCWTSSAVEGKGTPPSTESKIGVQKNCYISTATNGLQQRFQPASLAEIRAVFSKLPGWTVPADATKYPQIAGLNPIKSEADLGKPSAANQGGTVANNSTGTTTGDASSTVEETTTEGNGDADNSANTNEGTEISEGKGGTITTVIQDKTLSMTAKEKVVLIVLSALTVLFLAASIFVVILAVKFTRKPETDSAEAYDEIRDAEGDNE